MIKNSGVCVEYLSELQLLLEMGCKDPELKENMYSLEHLNPITRTNSMDMA